VSVFISWLDLRNIPILILSDSVITFPFRCSMRGDRFQSYCRVEY